MSSKSCSFLLFALLLGVVHADAQTSESIAVSETAEVDFSSGEVKVPTSLETLYSHESSYLTRCNFVQDLKSDLQADEIVALLQFITAAPKEVGLSRDHFNSVGDKVINALERQNTVPPALTDHLIAMFHDTAGDFTWRDYCIQHLGSLYATDAAAGKREQILHIWDEAFQPEARMAGTVVLALRKNMGQEGVSKEYIYARATEVASTDDQPDSSRMVAIQVAAELDNKDMLLLAHEIIASKHSVPFRMSAMATIGILGNSSDLDQLNKYTSSSSMRLRTASQAAVKKIEARMKTE